MKLTKEYIKQLIEKHSIPPSAWSRKYVSGKMCYAITNEIYCKIFWIDLWYNILSKKFKDQNMIERIDNLDLTKQVLIDESNLNIILPPPIVKYVDYYATERQKNSLFKVNINLNTVLIVALVTLMITALCTVVFGKKSFYTELV
nr:PIF-6 [Menippe mercenaria nudivirus]